MPYLSSIYIYPVKSFEPVSSASARIVAGGSLEHDRALALFDSDGKYVNGKRNPKVHRVRVLFDPAEGCVHVKVPAEAKEASFEYPAEIDRLNAMLSDYFEMPVAVRHQPDGGFPDDANAPGPTVVSTPTLETVTSWYDGLKLDEVRRRFRANIEIAECEPFWEDRLFGAPDEVVRFRIGEVEFEGINPCQRCVVPTRATSSGDIYPEFSNIFMQRRQETLPPWANQGRFNHFYRLAVNTRVAVSEVGKSLHVGDPVQMMNLAIPP